MVDVPEGGGASQTTEPASGSSAATDVSLRQHFEALLRASRELDVALRQSDRELQTALRASDLEAVRTALTAQKELASAHNDLLRKMEKLVETFIPKDVAEQRFSRIEAWQAKLTGGMLVLGAIGLSNLVKVWTS